MKKQRICYFLGGLACMALCWAGAASGQMVIDPNRNYTWGVEIPSDTPLSDVSFTGAVPVEVSAALSRLNTAVADYVQTPTAATLEALNTALVAYNSTITTAQGSTLGTLSFASSVTLAAIPATASQRLNVGDRAVSFNIAGGTTLTLDGNIFPSISGRGGAAITVAEYGLFAQTGAGTLAFTNNRSTNASGGAIYNSGTLSFSGPATFTNNTADNDGGAIGNNNGTASFWGPATFTRNSANYGGAIYNSGVLSFFGPAMFIDNAAITSTSGHGGAIFNTSGGTVNLMPAAGDTILFSGNQMTASGTPNSIYMKDSGTLHVGGEGAIDMRDPMGGEGSSLKTINKSGTGTWYLGGANTFADGSDQTVFTVSGGTLHLYRAREVDNGRSGAVAAGAITLDGTDSSFTLNSGATLSLGGTGHSISTGDTVTLDDDSTLAFDLAYHSSAPTDPMLTLTGTSTTVTVGNVGVDLLSLNRTNGTYTLASGADFTTTSATAPTFRGESLVGTLLNGQLTLTKSGTDLSLGVGSVPNNAEITWTGNGNGVWNQSALNNWSERSAGETRFLPGDAVIFDRTAANQTVFVNAGGVVVSDMTVSGGNYTFSGGEIVSTDQTSLSSPAQQLVVDGSGTRAVFNNNALDFANGLVVTGGAAFGGTTRVTGGMTINAGSVLSPGNNAIGTLTADRITFSPGSFFDVEVEPAGTGSDLLVVTGTAALAGTVRHIGLDETAAQYSPIRTWTILTAGNISGRFDAVTSNFAFLTASLLYDANAVRLQLSRNDNRFTDFTHTPNQRETAAGLESVGQIGTGGAMEVYNRVLAMGSEANLPYIFDILSGEIHPTLHGAMMEMDRGFRERQKKRLSGNPSAGVAAGALSENTDFWISVDRYKNTVDQTSNTGKGELRGWGASLGVEKEVSDWTLGAAFRYGDTEYKMDQRASRADLDTFNLGLYAGRPLASDFNLKLGAGYGLHQVDTKRRVDFMAQRVTANYNLHTLQAFGEVGWLKNLGTFFIEPYAGIAWNFSKNQSFTEHGGSAALGAKSEEHNNFTSSLGVRGQYQPTENITIGANLDYQHLFGDRNPEMRFSFAGGHHFTIEGAPMDRNTIGVGADVKVALQENISVLGGYLGRFGEDTDSHAGFLNLEISF